MEVGCGLWGWVEYAGRIRRATESCRVALMLGFAVVLGLCRVRLGCRVCRVECLDFGLLGCVRHTYYTNQCIRYQRYVGNT